MYLGVLREEAGLSSDLTPWPTSNFDLQGISKIYNIKTACNDAIMISYRRDAVRFSNPGGQAVMWWA